MGNTKKKEPGRRPRPINFGSDVNSYIDWLKENGFNFSRRVEEAVKSSDDFKNFERIKNESCSNKNKI